MAAAGTPSQAHSASPPPPSPCTPVPCHLPWNLSRPNPGLFSPHPAGTLASPVLIFSLAWWSSPFHGLRVRLLPVDGAALTAVVGSYGIQQPPTVARWGFSYGSAALQRQRCLAKLLLRRRTAVVVSATDVAHLGPRTWCGMKMVGSSVRGHQQVGYTVPVDSVVLLVSIPFLSDL